MIVEREVSLHRLVLLVDDDPDFRWATTNLLESSGYRVIPARDGEEALGLLEKDIPELVLLDYRMPGRSGLEIAEEMRDRIQAIPIIMITAYGEVKHAVKAMRMGVYDYVTKPVDNNDLLFTIRRALEKQDLLQEVEYLRSALSERTSLYELMGKSDQIKELVGLLEKVGPTQFTVLIEGESGSGKEIVARALHHLGKRSEGHFVAVDCGAIPETLIESELFGYRKGAFTGANNDKPGQFELADRGTLFLDEVGNLPMSVQHKLLRAMQERVVQRLGAREALPVDVRIIAATNQTLEKRVESGDFRSDLYFRLKEFVVKVPSLRQRRDDIPYLTKRFIDEAQEELKKGCSGVSKAAFTLLFDYEWPGNVRELRNVIRQAVLLCDENKTIKPEHLMLSGHLVCAATQSDLAAPQQVYDGKKSLRDTVRSITNDLEKRIISEAIAEAEGNKSEAARRLAIDYKTLLRKIKNYHIK
jgi:DNA-binding NtrC family response regulator